MFKSNQFSKHLYLTGTGASNFGDGVQIVALSLFLLDATGSALAIGAMIAVYYVPIFFLSPFAGVFSDQRNAKSVVIMMELCRTFLVLCMALALHLNSAFFAPLYVLQATLAITHLFFKPASQKMVREVFSKKDSVSVLSVSSTVGLIANIVGSGLAGWLIVSYSPLVCFVINAATYLISAVCYTFLQCRFPAEIKPPAGRYLPQIKEAVQAVVDEPSLLCFILFAMVGTASYRMVATVLAPFVSQSLNGSAELYSLMNMAFLLGGAAAGVVVSQIIKMFGSQMPLFSFAGIAGFSLLIGIGSASWVIVIGLLGLGFFTILNVSAMGAMLVVSSPKVMLGRIVSLRAIVAALTKIIFSIGAGFTAEVVDPQTVFLGFSVLAMALLFLTSQMRTLPLIKTNLVTA